jgi:uncharacterized membrane protein
MNPLTVGPVRLENVDESWAWLWVLLAVGVVGILVATYWGIFQRSERRLTWLLMVLRGAGLVALLLTLAKPSWSWENDLVESGRVAIVLDDSESMSLPDPSGRSRYARATEAVDGLRKALHAKKLVVGVYDIDGRPLKEGAIPDRPTAPRTDLAQALSAAADDMSAKRLNGVVLLSDGMDNSGRQDFAEFAQKFGVPIYTVGFEDTRRLGDLDLAVKPLRQPPERVMVNNEVKIDLLVSKTGGPRTEATVVIKRGLEERFVEKKIALPEGNDERTVSLTLKPSQPGTFEFTAVVESDKGERNLANNLWRFPLRVDAEPIRVLYVEGFLRYEYKFLKARLEDDPDLNVAAVVRRVNPELPEAVKAKDLITRTQLKNFDVVILGDMEADYLSPAEYQALVAWLDEKDARKGSEHALLVLGGYRSFGPAGFRKTRLAGVLPVVFADRPPYQSEEAFRIRLTEEGRGHPVFEVSSDRVRTAQAWDEAPRLAGCSLVARAKPAARVLAVHPRITREGKPAVVAAVQRYGAGHTMVLTVDTTWRWSRFTRVLGRADTLYARFWSQTLRWLAGRAADKRPLLSVSTDHIGYKAGEPVKVTVVRHPRPDVDLSRARLSVTYKPALGGRPAVVTNVKSTSADPDLFTGTFYPAAGNRPGAAGRFEVSATFTQDGKVVANQGTEFLVHSSGQELADTGTNPQVLKTLSEHSQVMDGYRDIGRAVELADLIRPKERRIHQADDLKLWDSPVLFLVFIGAVSSEWLIRRRNHLI